jgi:hypothetical protein
VQLDPKVHLVPGSIEWSEDSMHVKRVRRPKNALHLWLTSVWECQSSWGKCQSSRFHHPEPKFRWRHRDEGHHENRKLFRRNRHDTFGISVLSSSSITLTVQSVDAIVAYSFTPAAPFLAPSRAQGAGLIFASVVFSAGGDDGRKPPELSNPLPVDCTASDCRAIAIYEYTPLSDRLKAVV